MFPGSKSNDWQPDGAVFSLNSNLNYAFSQAISRGIDPKVDKRQNYRLVAAVWLDKPNFFGLEYPGPSPGVGPDGTKLRSAAPRSGRDVPERRHQPTGHRRDHRTRSCSIKRQPGHHLRHAARFVQYQRQRSQCHGSQQHHAVVRDPSRRSCTQVTTRRIFTKASKRTARLACPGRHGLRVLPSGRRGSAIEHLDGDLHAEQRLPKLLHVPQHQAGQRQRRAGPGSDGPNDVLLSKPALINVSHLFSEFLLQDRERTAAAPGN